MAKQETLTLFPEIEITTRKLTNEQFGELMRAVMAYRWRGESYCGSDTAIDIAFQFLSNQVDRGEAAKAVKTKAAKERWEKQSDADLMQSDAHACKAMHTDAEACTSVKDDAPIQSYPIHSYPIHSYPRESKAGKPPAPTKPDRKSFGEFGWVKLTDEEYSRLLNDLGEAEVKRCIAYVDESAEATGNKNRWRNWGLVIKKCHKQGWGQGNDARFPKKPSPIWGATGELGEAELEAIRRVLSEPDDAAKLSAVTTKGEKHARTP
jgi:hypothetical protein